MTVSHRSFLQAIAAATCDWMLEGNCRGMDPDLFHPHKEDHKGLARAVAICQDCPVKQPCLEHALEQGPNVKGVWAGTSEKQRDYQRRSRNLNRRKEAS